MKRNKAMELLWDSLLKDESELEAPDWYKDVLLDRIEKIKNKTTNFISLDELKASRK